MPLPTSEDTRTLSSSLQAYTLASNLRLIRYYVRPLWPAVVVAFVCAGALGVVSALLGALVGPCIQILTAPRDAMMSFVELLGPKLGACATHLLGTDQLAAGVLLNYLPWLLIVVAAGRGLFTLTQWNLWERSGEIVSRAMRADIASSYTCLSPSIRQSAEARRAEETLSSAVSNDIRLMREYLVHFYGGLPRELVQVIFMAITLYLLSPKLFLIFVLGVAPAGIAGEKIGKKLRKRAKKALADYSQLTEWLQQRLLGIETIKHYRTEDLEIQKMHAFTQQLYQRFLQAARVKARTGPILETLALVALVLVLIVALNDVANGVTTGSILMSFFATLGLLTQAIGNLGRYLNSNREGEAAIDRLRDLLSYLFAHRQDKTLLPKPVQKDVNRIHCENLCARYDGQTQDALSDFNFSFTGGKIYCLAGPSGAGKSTLFNLMLGLLKARSGRIEFSGPHTGDDRLPLCFMPQKVQLAPDTLAANVAYPHITYDRARVAESLRRVGLSTLIETLPAGLDTPVGIGGQGLSGGQTQRVLLARLSYHQAPLVLIDEGTSALDPEVELVVHALLRELADQGAVVITIAHRQGVAELADELLVLKAGKLVGQ